MYLSLSLYAAWEHSYPIIYIHAISFNIFMVKLIEKFNNKTNRILLSGSIATAQILLLVTATMLSHAYALNIVSTWGSPGSGNGQFNSPSGMDFDFKGHLYVVDTGNNRIQKLNATDGKFITDLGFFWLWPRTI